MTKWNQTIACINEKIERLREKIDNVFKYIKKRDYSNDLERIHRYSMTMTSDMAYLSKISLDKIDPSRVSHEMCEIAAFLLCGEIESFRAEFRELGMKFRELNAIYSEAYRKKYVVEPPLYTEWMELADAVIEKASERKEEQE